MANGAKRNKLKKLLSPPTTPNPPPLDSDVNPADHDELMDDLFAELDNRSPEVQLEAAKVLTEVRLNETTAETHVQSIPPPTGGKSSKQRFREREVMFQLFPLCGANATADNLYIQARKAEAIIAAQPPSDLAVEAKLEMEAKQEEAAIGKVCQSLGLEMHEVC